MGDTVKLLREWAEGPACRNPAHTPYINGLTAAADEIERLQAILAEFSLPAQLLEGVPDDTVLATSWDSPMAEGELTVGMVRRAAEAAREEGGE